MKLQMIDATNQQQDVIQDMLTKKMETFTAETNDHIKNFLDQIESL